MFSGQVKAGLAGALLAVLLTGLAAGAEGARLSPAGCDAADATACLQAAIDKASGAGADVLLPAGQYPVSAHLQLRSKVSLFGEPGAVILPTPDNLSEPVLVQGDGVSDLSISGIGFEGGGADFANALALVSLNGTSNVLLDQVSFRHVRGKALEVINTGSAALGGNGITNSVIEDIGNHWKATHDAADRIVAIVFWDADGVGMDGNFARSNHFADIGLDALQLTGQTGFAIEQNVFELGNKQRDLVKAGDYPAALFLTNNVRITISGNTIHEAVGNGIDAPGLIDSIIDGNTITGCGQAGIGIFRDYDTTQNDSSNLTISNNVIEDNAVWSTSIWRAGIAIGGGKPSGITIAGNTITDTRAAGKKTQDYGIDVVNGKGVTTKISKLVIAKDNQLKGNQRAATHGI